MQYTTEQIMKYLKDYHIYKGKVEIGVATESICQDVERLEKAISVLDEISYGIIADKYIDKLPAEKIARKYGYHRNGILYKSKCIVKNLAQIMSD